MIRVMRSLLVCLVLVLSLPAVAQELEISDEASVEEQALLAALIARAEEAAGVGTSDYDPNVYYAILETGLMRLMGQEGADARNIRIQRVDLATIEPSDAAIERVSNDIELQGSLDQIVERVRAGLRVIGGQTAEPGQFTSAVALVSSNNNTGCSGVVIEAGWILTAAHCYCDFRMAQGHLVRAVFANPVITQSTDKAFIIGGEMMDDDFCRKRENGSICSPDLALLHYPAEGNAQLCHPCQDCRCRRRWSPYRSRGHSRFVPGGVWCYPAAIQSFRSGFALEPAARQPKDLGASV